MPDNTYRKRSRIVRLSE